MNFVNTRTQLILAGLSVVWLLLSARQCLNMIRGPESLFRFELSCAPELIESLTDYSIAVTTIHGSEAVLQQTRPGSWVLSSVNDSGRRAVRNLRVVNAAGVIRSGSTPTFRLLMDASGQKMDVSLQPRQSGTDLLLKPREGDTRFSVIPRFKNCITYRGDASVIVESMIEGWSQMLVLALGLLAIWSGWKFSGFISC